MKAKYLFTTFLFLCISFFSFSQQTNGSAYFDPIVYNGLTRIEHNNMGSNNIDLSEVRGTPYENNNFQTGKATDLNTGRTEVFYIRYNIYNDVIELKTNPSDKAGKGLIKSEKIYVTINGKKYQYKKYIKNNSNTKEGYFILLKKGNHSSLYLKKIKKFKDKVVPQNSIEKEKPAEFIDDHAYYLQKGDVLVQVSSRKKKFLEQYPEISKKLGKYIKSERINLKSEKDLIKLFGYMDTLLK